ncbi:MAG: shikimate kinase [Muribaculaceae bacterium]|nr:shikimate kinase [Muribaculaceae bacterium]
MTIFLIGYMASGKTTLGRALARELGHRFIDLDFYIEQRFRRRIPEIFAANGEDGFREIEARMLREAGEFCDTVISCGGGTPCHGDNMDYMLSHGVTVWLDAGVECICRRLATAKTRRPIVEGKSAEELPSFIAAHLAERLPHYRRAEIRISSERLESRGQIADTIATLRPLLTEHGRKGAVNPE